MILPELRLRFAAARGGDIMCGQFTLTTGIEPVVERFGAPFPRGLTPAI